MLMWLKIAHYEFGKCKISPNMVQILVQIAYPSWCAGDLIRSQQDCRIGWTESVQLQQKFDLELSDGLNRVICFPAVPFSQAQNVLESHKVSTS